MLQPDIQFVTHFLSSYVPHSSATCDLVINNGQLIVMQFEVS